MIKIPIWNKTCNHNTIKCMKWHFNWAALSHDTISLYMYI